ncbi:RNA polymerase sigma factor [Embleya sp. NPDC005575]|uniref:RNA polymerase sigma factor n=1 Tax=Embleya sp. NPDC005575 TaxID=3156892 RepID=UPI0033B4B012
MAPPDHHDVRAIARDRAALEAFYREHFDTVLAFVARRVDDPHSAADLTSDVFVAALGSAHTYRGGPGGGRAWLFGVARNVMASDRHRAAREADARRRAAGRRLTDPDDIQRLEERLDAEQQARKAYRAIRTLPDADRAVLELVVVDGLSVSEAARVLDVGTVAARVRLHRARRRLVRRLAAYDGPGNAQDRLHPVTQARTDSTSHAEVH